MNIGKIGKVLLLFIFVIGLSACNDDREDIIIDDKEDIIIDDKEDVIIEYTVSLYYGDELIEIIENIEEGTLIVLPVLEEDGMLFVGYEDGDSIYYDEYPVTGDITLYASFEVITDVFDFLEYVDAPTINVMGYTGNATHLKIPKTINGKVVSYINNYAFEESNLLEVIIPIDAFVSSFAFINSTDLKEVSFYGKYLLGESAVLSNLHYDEIIAEYTDTCIITEGSIEEGFWTFSDGCPIKEVLSENLPVMI